MKIMVLLLLGTISGCSLFGGYSYNDWSHPNLPEPPLNLQVKGNVSTESFLNPTCHIKTTRRNYKTLWLWHISYGGSALLIDRRYLLTAAHNVYDYPLSYLTSISVSCGVNTANKETVVVKLNRSQILKNVSSPRYEIKIRHHAKKFEHDYAFVDLGTTIPGAIEVKLISGTNINNGDGIYLSGYPGGRISDDASTLYYSTGKVVSKDGNLFTYDIKTDTGNSGGPVFKVIENEIIPIGVHVSNSRARLIDDILISDWKAWLSKKTKS